MSDQLKKMYLAEFPPETFDPTDEVLVKKNYLYGNHAPETADRLFQSWLDLREANDIRFARENPHWGEEKRRKARR